MRKTRPERFTSIWDALVDSADEAANLKVRAELMREIAALVQGDRVHSRVYTDPAIFAREQERIFRRVWLYLCHESQIAAPGDFLRTRLAGGPLWSGGPRAPGPAGGGAPAAGPS